MTQRAILRRDDILEFITKLYHGDLHAKRVLSLSNATLGVLTSASLAVHAIGFCWLKAFTRKRTNETPASPDSCARADYRSRRMRSFARLIRAHDRNSIDVLPRRFGVLNG